MREKFANFPQCLLNAVCLAGDTTITVSSAAGFPQTAQFRVLVDNEILLVTAGAGTTSWTVTRAQEGTTAVMHSNGAVVTHVITAGSLDKLRQDNLHLYPSGGRLTLQSGTPVPSGDQTAKTTVYFTPHVGNRIALYDGSQWRVNAFSEVSVAVPGTVNTPFDVFGHEDATEALVLETVNWSSDSARASALAQQDGVWVKSGDATRRYLGTGRTTGTSGKCEDSRQNRLLWNLLNRVRRPLKAFDANPSWSYSTAAWRQADGSTGNQVGVVVGQAEAMVELFLLALNQSSNTGMNMSVGIGEDSTTSPHADSLVGFCQSKGVNLFETPLAALSRQPAAGYHYYAWLEYGHGSLTQTWYGSSSTLQQAGLVGSIDG